ncbi:Hypothetical protein A7982_00006 [Minicystis rosea]|nr:Hypothetical protein A7982_00006 [Minicystis rosea]
MKRFLAFVLLLPLVAIPAAETACGGCFPIHATNVQTSPACLSAAPDHDLDECVGARVTVRVTNECAQPFVVESVGDAGVDPINPGESAILDDHMAVASGDHRVVSGTVGGAPAAVAWDQQ